MFHGQNENAGEQDDCCYEAHHQVDAAGDELVSVRCEFLSSIGVLAVKDALAAAIQQPGTDQGEQDAGDVLSVHVVAS